MNNNKSKKNQYAWIAVGIIILAFVLSSLIQQGIAKKRTAGMLKALQLVLPASTQVSADSLDQLSNEQPETAVINGLPVIGELLVPTIDVDTALITDYSGKNLSMSPCIVSGSAAGRDLVIAGGNYRSQFASLNTLRTGDTVMICDMNGNLFIYDVDSVEFADKENAVELSGAGFDLSLCCINKNGSVRYAARCTLCE